MPMINIDDAYILGETGEQVDKVTGLFTKDEDTTSGEKAFAQLNIGTAGSNRNLLDNSFFTVNQRSATTVTLNGTEAYIADRWIVGAFGTYTHNSDNTITITCPNSTAFAGLTQRIDPIYKGRTYTFSIRLSDDTVISLQGTMPSGSGLNVYNININGTAWQVLFRSDGSAYWVTLRCNVANTTITIKAVKLEFGSVSTLANDAPPDYAEEILKCEYRCVVYDLPTNTLLCRGIATSTTNIAGVIDLPRDMAEDKTPTVSITGSLTTPAGNTITAIAGATYARKNKLRVNFTGTGFNSGTVYDIFTGSATPKITISADL